MKIKTKQSLEEYIELNLREIQKETPPLVKFWYNFYTYLAVQRNTHITDIKKSFKVTCAKKGIFYRVVYSNFMNNPLNLRGSLLNGGRFNFGKDTFEQDIPTEDKTPFSCLYISSDEETAKREAFPNDKYDDLSSSELSLKPDRSYLVSCLDVKLNKCIDIRHEKSLNKFTEITSNIEITKSLKNEWRLANKTPRHQPPPPLKLIKSPSVLKQNLLEKNYKQWSTICNMASNSQWFGYYIKEARLEGIIYPSTKNKSGFNLALFPYNFRSGSYVSLKDKHSAVQEVLHKIKKDNYRVFEEAGSHLH